MVYYCEVHPGVTPEVMGHSPITVTETYLKSFKNKKIDEANVAVISSSKKVYSVGELLSQRTVTLQVTGRKDAANMGIFWKICKQRRYFF